MSGKRARQIRQAVKAANGIKPEDRRRVYQHIKKAYVRGNMGMFKERE